MFVQRTTRMTLQSARRLLFETRLTLNDEMRPLLILRLNPRGECKSKALSVPLGDGALLNSTPSSFFISSPSGMCPDSLKNDQKDTRRSSSFCSPCWSKIGSSVSTFMIHFGTFVICNSWCRIFSHAYFVEKKKPRRPALSLLAIVQSARTLIRTT